MPEIGGARCPVSGCWPSCHLHDTTSIWRIKVIIVVFLSTRDQCYNWLLDLQWEAFWYGYIHITFCSQATPLHDKPHRTLWSSLVHCCRRFSTTLRLHWTYWNRWAIASVYRTIVCVALFKKTYWTLIVAVTGTLCYCQVFAVIHLQKWNVCEPHALWET